MNTTQRDHYEVLGVSKDASLDNIRKAYRKLARKYHPDKTGGDTSAEEKLKEINAAYGVLKKADKRKEYDEETAFRQQGFGGPGGGDFADIFSSMFGGASGPSRGAYSPARPGNDLRARVTVTLKDVVSGTQKVLRIKRAEVCGDCKGSGAADGAAPENCPVCRGSGHVARGNGMFQMTQTCGRCQGRGRVAANPCARCSGSGRAQRERELSVGIPPGADSGMRLRLAGEGEAGYHDGPRGDLFVEVQVAPDPFFTREGSSLRCEVPITFAEAALGAKVTVPTLDGVATLTVPAGTQNGAQLRMRGMGLPALGTKVPGDEVVEILVEVPRKLTQAQKDLLREFSGHDEPESHPLRDRFFGLLATLRDFVGR